MIWVSIVLGIPLGLVSLCLGYLYLLALASIANRPPSPSDPPVHRFAIAIPACNEEEVIGATLDALLKLDYPRSLFDIHVVSDNSTDSTAEIVRERDVSCWERFDDTRRSKGHALVWLFERILEHERSYTAIVVFDADSRVDARFLRAMDRDLRRGGLVLQGRHVIANLSHNWYSAAMYTSFALDNLRNGGRSALGLSAKLMGDGMCFAREVLERHPWMATNLTEDAEYQALLLLNGIRVTFVPDALSYGEIPTSLGVAGRQWSRWMHGRSEVSRRLAPQLLRRGLENRNLAQLDGAIEQVMPSLSTLVVSWGLVAMGGGAVDLLTRGLALPWGWILGLGAAFGLYPVLGLLLAGAPRAVYAYLALAPFYSLWRTGLRVWVNLRKRPQQWVRTPRSSASKPRGDS
jgi:cellulose synthase/poly-beta-1,6-N-acetylglucosamine synthase-like glycosyltransferase